MTIDGKICTASKAQNRVAKYTAIFGHITLAIIWVMSTFQTTTAQVDCSVVFCTSADQQVISGYDMFDDTNFAPVVDGLGRTRQFYVHIPSAYDTLTFNELMPTMFAFHGGGQNRSAMIVGKWGDYFNQEVAFVIPLGEPNPCDPAVNPIRIWLGPTWAPGIPGGGALPANCDPATQRLNSLGNPVTYFSADLSDTFTDILFVENLRSIVLSRFPKLNANKVYATGFSSGGGMSYSLLC